MMNIYQHFRGDEQSFIDQVVDWILQVENQYTPYLTSFLNPRELFIVQSVMGQYDSIQFEMFGGYEGAEQQRVLIYPPYYEPTEKDFEITLFEINYPTKFAELSHGQIMGTVLGTGISRGNLGDILTDGNRWQFLIDQTMKDFIDLNLDRVGRVNVNLEEKTFDTLVEITDKWEPEEIIVSSLRIDVILAQALHLSRNRAKTMINDNKIKLNWVEVNRPDIDVEEYDILSVRGFGRIRIGTQKGTTRKDNIVLNIGVIDRNS